MMRQVMANVTVSTFGGSCTSPCASDAALILGRAFLAAHNKRSTRWQPLATRAYSSKVFWHNRISWIWVKKRAHCSTKSGCLRQEPTICALHQTKFNILLRLLGLQMQILCPKTATRLSIPSGARYFLQNMRDLVMERLSFTMFANKQVATPRVEIWPCTRFLKGLRRKNLQFSRYQIAAHALIHQIQAICHASTKRCALP